MGRELYTKPTLNDPEHISSKKIQEPAVANPDTEWPGSRHRLCFVPLRDMSSGFEIREREMNLSFG